MANTTQQPPLIDTLRLSEAEAARLCARLDRASQSFHGRDLRQHLRLAVTPTRPMVARVSSHGAAPVDYAVRTRNISRGGAAFLHGGFVHPDAQCELFVGDGATRRRRIAGRVVQCRHVERHAHEVAVRFDTTVDSCDDLLGGTRDDRMRLAVTSPRFRGAVLCVDAAEPSRQYARHLLSRVGVRIDLAVSAAEGQRRLDGQRYDVVLVDGQLPGLTGLGFIRAQRFIHPGVPMVLLTDDDRECVRRQALDAGCDFVLDKPLELEALAMALGRFLPRDDVALKQCA